MGDETELTRTEWSVLTGGGRPDTLEAARAGEIETVIDRMLVESRDNFMVIEALALECSAALTSAEAKSSGLSEQGVFKRLWNSLTGKNDRLREAIEKDRAAAQYAMQRAITSVLRECTQNRMLALAVKRKLERDMAGGTPEDDGPDDTERYQEDTEHYTAQYAAAAGLFLKTMDQYMESAAQFRDDLEPEPVEFVPYEV